MNPTETTDSESASAGGGTSVVGLCPICRTPTAGETVQCMHCGVIHHRDCWDYNGGCGKYGCTSAPATEKLSDLEVPASFWGLDEKECPACRARIQAAALRCRSCGTVFSTTRPQETGEFHAQRSQKQDLPILRRNIVILLVLSILPFTAPLAAVVGGIWYAVNRRRLAALPTTQAAMAWIALLIATGQTTLLILFAALHSVMT